VQNAQLSPELADAADVLSDQLRVHLHRLAVLLEPHADQIDRVLSFDPKGDGDVNLPWSSGTAWGTIARINGKVSLKVLGGLLDVDQITVAAHTFAPGDLA